MNALAAARTIGRGLGRSPVSAAVAATYRSEVLADSPYLAWFAADYTSPTAQDATVNDRDGTVSGTLNTTTPGLLEARNFALGPGGLNAAGIYPAQLEMGVEAVFKAPTAQVAAGVYGWTIGGLKNGGSHERNVYLQANRTIRWYVIANSAVYLLDSVSTIAADTRTHVYCDVSAAGVMQIFINGVLDASLATGGTVAESGYNPKPTLGESTGGGPPLACDLDGFAIYSTIPSATRVAAHSGAMP